MAKVEWSDEEVSDAIEDGEEIGCAPWRWGTRRTYVVEKDGKHFRFTAEFHSEEGLQGLYSGPEEVVQVERVVKEWVRGTAPSEGATPEET